MGFHEPPDPLGTKAFERAVTMINELPRQPDLILFTGDLIDDGEYSDTNEKHLKLFQKIVRGLKAAPWPRARAREDIKYEACRNRIAISPERLPEALRLHFNHIGDTNMNKLPITLFLVVFVLLTARVGAAAPVAGDTYVYRVFNGYNHEARGQIRHHVDKVDAGRVIVSVTTDTPGLGSAHTEIYTTDGNWMRHPVTNHDQPVDFEFAQAYPAFVLPLEPGKSWSVRVNATDPVTGKRNNVRVDGKVLGAERITTPAGAFDTIKVMREVYAGDWEAFRQETNITETDWYAPALGRPVRSESYSGYMDPSRCTATGSACTPIRGDWSVLELVTSNPAPRP